MPRPTVRNIVAVVFPNLGLLLLVGVVFNIVAMFICGAWGMATFTRMPQPPKFYE